MKTRDEQVVELTKRLMEGGWSSVFSFVNNHVEDWELEDDDEDDYLIEDEN